MPAGNADFFGNAARLVRSFMLLCEKCASTPHAAQRHQEAAIADYRVRNVVFAEVWRKRADDPTSTGC